MWTAQGRQLLYRSAFSLHRRGFATDEFAQKPQHSVLRFDVMNGTWVVFSLGRRNRPQQTNFTTSKIRISELPKTLSSCPFCAGNEHMTPKTLLSRNAMRVVSNKYPAVAPLKFDDKHCQNHSTIPFLVNDDGLLLNNQMDAVGFHEVVVESPFHNEHIATQPSQDMARDLLTMFRDRGLEHREFENIEHTVFFKNHGSTAGASLIHPHSQIVSTPVVPVEAQRLQNLSLDYFRRHRRNLYEQVISEELDLYRKALSDETESRIVELTENFIALIPYASPGPYVIKILPRFQATGLASEEGVNSSDFTTMTDDLVDECACVLHSCLSRLYTHLEPDFNLVVQTAPVAKRGVQASLCASAFFRWHIRITPRLGAGAMAGFELGSGFFSNSHMPEDDARELRALAPLLVE